MKLENRIKLLIAIYLLLLIWAISSCGIVNKHKDIYVHNIDSSFVQVRGNIDSSRKDTTHVATIDRAITDSSTVHVEFNYDSASYTAEPITIQVDSIGKITVNSGGRKVKSITSTKKKIDAFKSADSTHSVIQMHASFSDSINATKHTQETHTVNKVQKFQIPWYAYLIAVVALVLVFIFWNQIRLARKAADNIKIPYNKL